MRRLIGAGLGVAAMLLAGTVATPQAQAQDEVTMVIGLTQPWETINPVVGYTVAAYEFFNIQYASLVNRAAADYSPVPGLAESWVENEPGLSYTYTLREGLQWSDGEPLTAEDIAWNINTARDQEWSNYISAVTNMSAEVVDERTVTITSSAPDPKLPMLEIYVVPKHIWEAQATPDTLDTYEALDGVGSGPYVLEELKSEESLTMVANEHYWGGRPAIDRVIFRYFSNPDAMVAAIQRGEIDAAVDVPAASMADLEGADDIEVVAGFQGAFDEIAVNGGAAEGQPHPALLDLAFRQAIAHGIDKAGITEDLWYGFARPATSISPGADFKWVPDIPEDELFGYDPELANQLLDDAGYLDTNDDGFREMPGGGDNIVLRHAVNTDGDLAGAVGDTWVGWMNALGIDIQLDAYDQDQLFNVILEGTYDTFYWGWVPYVDPDPMLSYFTTAELGNFNDANWADPEFDALYEQQKVELDPAARLDLVHQMMRILYDNAGYIALWYGPDLQAYRTDKFEGFQSQPTGGPVIFSQSSPSYQTLRPIGAAPPTTEPSESATENGGTDTATADTGESVTATAEPAPGDTATEGSTETATGDAGGDADDDGGGSGGVIAIIVVVLAALGIGGFALSKRRKSADDRE